MASPNGHRWFSLMEITRVARARGQDRGSTEQVAADNPLLGQQAEQLISLK